MKEKILLLTGFNYDKENALFYLNRSLKNKEIKTEFVKDDEDWINYLKNDDFN